MQNLNVANSDKPVDFYSLDVIISVGYRVKSQRGGGYFKELLERIRDIRASEKVSYHQVLEIYATSIDYNPKAEVIAEKDFMGLIEYSALLEPVNILGRATRYDVWSHLI